MVLKVTSILSRQQRDIAEKEAKLLSRLSHPSIIKMYDTCYRTVTGEKTRRSSKNEVKERPQHLILMEFCEGGHALDVCTRLVENGERFDLSTLIIAFGQICNAVSYLHAQRPPIVHRDLKPANFLVKNGAYKLCDFGSAVFGHVDLKSTEARQEAEEVIQKTTTQMFRAPEMVDLFMAKKLTQATDVWALGCCLYSLAFLQNCFEEGSNLAILSRKFKIPDDNPYGDGLVELIDRMLTVDSKARADMTEVILCLSAVYSGRPLPPRKERSSKKKDKEGSEKKEKDKDKSSGSSTGSKKKKGTFRTDGQGIYGEDLAIDPNEAAIKKPVQAKKLDPNSAAARRRAAAGDMEFASFHSRFDEAAAELAAPVNQDLAFSTTDNPFASFDASSSALKNQSSGGNGEANDSIFASFDGEEADLSNGDITGAFGEGKFEDFCSFSPDGGGEAQVTEGNASRDQEDDDDDEDDEGPQDPPEDGKRHIQRRRRSGSRRTRSTSASDPDSGNDNGEGDSEGKSRPTVHRTRSGSRRTSRTAKKIDGEDMEAAVGEVAAEEESEKTGRSSTRRARPSSGRPRSGTISSSKSSDSTRKHREGGSSSRRREKEAPAASAGGD